MPAKNVLGRKIITFTVYGFLWDQISEQKLSEQHGRALNKALNNIKILLGDKWQCLPLGISQPKKKKVELS